MYITDNHMHVDPVRGRGLDAVKEFSSAGGTHLLVYKLYMIQAQNKYWKGFCKAYD